MKFGLTLEHLKAKTPFVMRAIGSALIGSCTAVASIDFVYGKISGGIAAALIGFFGKFLTECFAEHTVVEGTIAGERVKVTEALPEPSPAVQELSITPNPPTE